MRYLDISVCANSDGKVDPQRFHTAVNERDPHDTILIENGHYEMDFDAVFMKPIHVMGHGTLACKTLTFAGDASSISYAKFEGGKVVVASKDFRSRDAHYHCEVQINNGSHGAWVIGGSVISSGHRQMSSGISVVPGKQTTNDVRLEHVQVSGGSTSGIALYDVCRASVKHCRVSDCRRIPSEQITGWTKEDDELWVADGHSKGAASILLFGGKFVNYLPKGRPVANQFTSASGKIRVNLGGQDPNTKPMIAGLVSGYGVFVYTTGTRMDSNRIENNLISDTDGYGIYLQLGSKESRGLDNHTSGNRLSQVCLDGDQNFNLNWGGIVVAGGKSTKLQRDSVEASGSNGVATSSDADCWMDSMRIVGSKNAGYRIYTGTARLFDSSLSENLHGVCSITNPGQTVAGLQIRDCDINNNRMDGISLFNSGGVLRGVVVTGCDLTGNLRSNIAVRGVDGMYEHNNKK